MIDWLGLGKTVVSEASRRVDKHNQHKHELRWDFVLEAIGPHPGSCLELATPIDDGVSFTTIDRRLTLLQQDEPEKAHKAGIPEVYDPGREQWIRNVLQEMVMARLIERCRITDRWKIAKS